MQPTAPRAGQTDSQDLAVRVIVSFDESPLATYWVRRCGGLHPHGAIRTLWVGEGPGVTVPSPDSALPAPRFPLVRTGHDGCYELLCPEAAVGGLRVNGAPITLLALCRAGLAIPCDEYPGVWALDLSQIEELTLRLGLLEFHVCLATLPPRLALPPRRDLRAQLPTLAMAALAAALMLLAAALPPLPRPLLALSKLQEVIAISFTPDSANRLQRDGAQDAGGMTIAAQLREIMRGRYDCILVADRPRGPARSLLDTPSLRRAASEPASQDAQDTSPGAPDVSERGTAYAALLGDGSVLGDAQGAMAEVTAGSDGMGGPSGDSAGIGRDTSTDSPIPLDDLTAFLRGSSATCDLVGCLGYPNAGRATTGLPRYRSSANPETKTTAANGAAMSCGHGSPCDKDAIRRVIQQHKNEVRYCYEQGLIRSPELQGRVVIQFVIAEDGKVARSTVSSSTIAVPDVGACIARAAQRWQFLPPGSTHIEVNYPFDLRVN